MEKRTIWVKPSCFTPEIEMIIPIPEDRDAEEYIDSRWRAGYGPAGWHQSNRYPDRRSSDLDRAGEWFS